MELDQKQIDRAVESAVELGVTVLKNGGTTRAADRTFRRVLKGCEHDEISAAWRLDFVTARSVMCGYAVTIVRPIGSIGVNLFRASEAMHLGERVERGEVAPAGIDAEIERINALPPQYATWLAMAAGACSAIGFARLSGTDWGASAIAGIAATVGKFVGTLLRARGAPPAPVTLISGIVSSGIAALAFRLGVSGMGPSALIGSVLYLTPGLPLINGFVEIVSERYLMVGLERVANAALLLAVLAIAVQLTVGIVL